MCHNLGANEGADPFTPAAEIHGAMYQFGIGTEALSQADNLSNTGEVPGWNNSVSGSGDWDMVTQNPCPPGWRVPTIEEWAAVINTSNNAITKVGTDWTSGSGNYYTGTQIGDALFLPTAGLRSTSNGSLNFRGIYGYYWSSTADGSYNGHYLGLNSVDQGTGNNFSRSYGFSVRCVAE
jgi:uncharacterized protein (TIGR02145 family)